MAGTEEHERSGILGHANITTTSRYLASQPLRLEQAAAKPEGITFSGLA